MNEEVLVSISLSTPLNSAPTPVQGIAKMQFERPLESERTARVDESLCANARDVPANETEEDCVSEFEPR